MLRFWLRYNIIALFCIFGDTSMSHTYLFRFSFKNKYQGAAISWDPGKENSFIFFASLLEKIKMHSASVKPGEKDLVRILLADDDEDDRQLFEEAIAKIDPLVAVESVGTGNELLDLLEKGAQPDIIFLDLNMPGKNGKECLGEIRQHPLWKKFPVIIYSTSSNKKDIQDTYSGGATLYLLKPTSFRELIRIIQKVFSFNWQKKKDFSLTEFVLTQLK